MPPQPVCANVGTAYAASDGANHLDRDLGAKLEKHVAKRNVFAQAGSLAGRPLAQSIDRCSAQGDEITIERAKQFKKIILARVR